MEILRKLLLSINRKGYKAYKGIAGKYDFKDYTLFIDYVQGDPFASPSRIRVRIPHVLSDFKEDLFNTKHKKIAFCDFLSRVFSNNIKRFYKNPGGTGKSGLLFIDTPAQEVLERTSCVVNDSFLEVRLEIGLPASGRRILSDNAINIFFDGLPKVVEQSLFLRSIDQKQLQKHIQTFLNQEFIREQMKTNGICSFLADGSVLPRESGISSKPMKKGAVVFESPASMKIQFELLNGIFVTGLGIKEGITLIIGGGFHGKSTVLNAIELGIYNHVSGDGREYVLTRPDAVKIRAEDGRRVEKVDISHFIDELPGQKGTKTFSTENASGSTSQAANIVEALESKTSLLLIDEDTCATNFMFRDDLMKQIVKEDKEPIKPFIEKASGLYEDNGISTIMVAGSSGEYFRIADSVIMMDEYLLYDVSEQAKELGDVTDLSQQCFRLSSDRSLVVNSFEETKRGLKVKTRSNNIITVNKSEIDLTYIEQIVESSQLNTIGAVIEWIKNNYHDKTVNFVEIIDNAMKLMNEKGLDEISKYRGRHPGNFSSVGKQEIMFAINRYRKLKMKIL